MRTPLSPLIFGSRGFSLLVPTKTLPSATTGPPYASEPRVVDQRTRFSSPRLKLQSVGMFLSEALTMFRAGVPPNMGHPVRSGDGVLVGAAAVVKGRLTKAANAAAVARIPIA